MEGLQFDEALTAARQGDEQGFATIWRAFNPPLLRYLRGMGAIEEREDLASQTWLEAVRRLEHFTGDESGFRSWLFTIARHRLIDMRRTQARRPEKLSAEPVELEGNGDDPGSLAETRWSTEQALALIGSLPPGQAEVVLLRVVAGLSNAEVAEIMGKREGTVRVLGHRALKKLAKRVDGAVGIAPRSGRVTR